MVVAGAPPIRKQAQMDVIFNLLQFGGLMTEYPPMKNLLQFFGIIQGEILTSFSLHFFLLHVLCSNINLVDYVFLMPL